MKIIMQKWEIYDIIVAKRGINGMEHTIND